MENHGTLPFVLRGNRKESRLQLRKSAFSVEGGHAGVNGACTQILLNAEQLGDSAVYPGMAAFNVKR